MIDAMMDLAARRFGDDPPSSETGDGEAPLKNKAYEKKLRRLQAELCHMQEWIKATGERIIVVFEGRDAAGKGGIIKAITERVSPRVFRVAALPAPSDREKTQMYVRLRARLNCIAHLLSQIPYRRMRRSRVDLVGRSMKRAYDDEKSITDRQWIPEAK